METDDVQTNGAGIGSVKGTHADLQLVARQYL